MFRIGKHCHWLVVVVIMSSLCQPPPIAADSERSRETAAVALLSEALMLMEWTKNRGWCVAGVTNGDRAKKAFERILKDYSTTKAAGVAEYRYPDSLMCLGSLDDAISAAKSVAAKRPDTTAAAWAQLRVGESLARAGAEESENAARELRKVAAMLPDRSDLGPANESRMVLGRLCEGFLANHGDALDAAELLGLDKADPQGKSETLAIVAAFKGRLGQTDAAFPLLERLARECPGELEEIRWARCRVAIAYLQSSGCQGQLSRTAVGWLSDIPSRAGDDMAAEACLWRARYYGVHGPLAQAISILEDGKERFLDTAHGAEILYGLGCALDRSGKRAEAAAAMRDVVKLKPFAPFYASLAEFFIARQAAAGTSASVVSAMRDAEASYSPERRFLAYRPADPLLSPGWMTAAQVVSLIKEELNEEALRIVTALPISGNLSPSESLRAMGEVLLCSMRSASTLDRLLHAQPDTLLPLASPRLAPEDRESTRVRCDLLDAAWKIATEADASRCSPDGRRQWLAMLANINAQSARRATAIRLYTQALAIPGASRDVQAQTEYRIGMCYREMKQKNSAYSVMQRLSERYSDTSWGAQARRTANGWKVLEGLEKEKAQQQGATSTTAE